MQFGRVLAFATLVLASPTPMKLEDRDASVSINGVADSINKATSTIKNIVKGNAVNIAAGLTAAVAPVDPLTSSAVAAAASLGAAAIKNVEGSVSSSAQIIVSDLHDTIANLTALSASISATAKGDLKNALNNIVDATTKLANTLAFTDLAGLLTLTASASSNIGQVVGQEAANLQALVGPFVTALTGLQAAASAGVGSSAPTIADGLAKAIGSFVTQVSAVHL